MFSDQNDIIAPPVPRWCLEDFVLELLKKGGVPTQEYFPDDPELACMYENDSLGG